MKNKNLILIIGLVVLISGAVLLAKTPGKSGKYDEFALCLAEKDFVFYGTFWCRYCQEQKGLFGKSSKKLPYVECSTPDGQGQLKICADADIQTYPTWVFPDGEIVTGVISLEDLADSSDCSLPV